MSGNLKQPLPFGHAPEANVDIEGLYVRGSCCVHRCEAQLFIAPRRAFGEGACREGRWHCR